MDGCSLVPSAHGNLVSGDAEQVRCLVFDLIRMYDHTHPRPEGRNVFVEQLNMINESFKSNGFPGC